MLIEPEHARWEGAREKELERGVDREAEQRKAKKMYRPIYPEQRQRWKDYLDRGKQKDFCGLLELQGILGVIIS